MWSQCRSAAGRGFHFLFPVSGFLFPAQSDANCSYLSPVRLIESMVPVRMINFPQVHTLTQDQLLDQSQVQAQAQVQTRVQTQVQARVQPWVQTQVRTQAQAQVQARVQAQVQTQVQDRVQAQVQTSDSLLPVCRRLQVSCTVP